MINLTFNRKITFFYCFYRQICYILCNDDKICHLLYSELSQGLLYGKLSQCCLPRGLRSRDLYKMKV